MHPARIVCTAMAACLISEGWAQHSPRRQPSVWPDPPRMLEVEEEYLARENSHQCLVNSSPSPVVDVHWLRIPRHVRQRYDRAQHARAGGNVSLAASELERAVHDYPEFGKGWSLLGEMRLELNQDDAARGAFNRAIALDSASPEPKLGLAWLMLKQNRAEDAIALAEPVRQQHPGLAEAHYVVAVAYHTIHEAIPARDAALTVIRLGAETTYPRVHLIIGDILSMQGQTAAAITAFENFLQLEPSGETSERVRARLATWGAPGGY